VATAGLVVCSTQSAASSIVLALWRNTRWPGTSRPPSPDGTGWAVLADLEGNEFCVLRGAAERVSTG
jgi:hypothetical protein